jgi:hypothetical protein
MNIADTLYANFIAWIAARDESRDESQGYNPNPTTPEDAARRQAARDAEAAAFAKLPEYFRECWQKAAV